MRKFLRKFFWSHGTLLGYLGSLSQKGHPEIFSKWVLTNLSNPLRHPEPLVDPLLTKNLVTAGPRCDDDTEQKDSWLIDCMHALTCNRFPIRSIAWLVMSFHVWCGYMKDAFWICSLISSSSLKGNVPDKLTWKIKHNIRSRIKTFAKVLTPFSFGFL